ncbi:hypothetical protein EBL87_17980 [Cereibacter sphaeroides]|uniref:TniQ family protein n=1 Tax=Cereibacter sphaeroides TaxID=1063 RepID=UPI000F526BBD|nr:TniQ family protein [Cereibacter sphaeroides]AZB65619.1 hypothetical protein EBL87_17980 [Cereibacter sphaeroides]AZB70374.1 hypothetical protein EBL86_18535 [Cereibacter sphaeroides]
MTALGVTLPGDLLDWSPVKSGGALRVLRGHAFPAKVILVPQIRGCPVCLRADAVGSGAPPHIAMALRGHWLVPHVTLCLDHHHPLVPLWRDPQPGSRNDSVARFREIADEILAGRLDQETREPTDFDLWIDARLSGTAQVNWLDAQPLHAAATFCHILGTALLRLEQVLPAWVRRSDRWALYQMGFEVASQGEEAIRSALRRLQKLADGPQDGPKKVFPLLYDRLSHDYRDDPNFEAFRRILRDHMVETWPLGPGDELMGEPVTERRLHSVRTAAQATGIDQRRMRRMLAAAGIVPEAAEGTCDAWETFGAAAAQPILDDLTALMPANAFAEFIGASRSQFDLLVKDGVLAPALDAPGVKAVWSPVQGRAFLDGLLCSAVPLAKVPRGWEHLPKSAQRLKIGPGAIVTAIREGRIPGVGRLEGVDGYAAVHVNHADVTRVLGAESPTAQPGQAAVELRVDADDLPELFRAGEHDGHRPRPLHQRLQRRDHVLDLAPAALVEEIVGLVDPEHRYAEHGQPVADRLPDRPPPALPDFAVLERRQDGAAEARQRGRARHPDTEAGRQSLGAGTPEGGVTVERMIDQAVLAAPGTVDQKHAARLSPARV